MSERSECLDVDGEEADRLLEAAQHGKGDVVDGDAAAGGAAQCAAVRMAVDDGGGSELVERAREARRAEERVDLQRLAFDGGAARRVVEQGDARARAELEERVLELQLFGDACVDE